MTKPELLMLIALWLGVLFGLALILLSDWWAQRRRDRADRAWRRQWHEDYRKQQERHRW